MICLCEVEDSEPESPSHRTEYTYLVEAPQLFSRDPNEVSVMAELRLNGPGVCRRAMASYLSKKICKLRAGHGDSEVLSGRPYRSASWPSDGRPSGQSTRATGIAPARPAR